MKEMDSAGHGLLETNEFVQDQREWREPSHVMGKRDLKQKRIIIPRNHPYRLPNTYQTENLQTELAPNVDTV